MKGSGRSPIAFAALPLLFVCSAVFLRAQPAAQAQAKHCLWKVERGTNTAHLFGSIHFLKKEFYPLAKPIEDAFRQSDVVVFEVDFDEMQSPQSQLTLLQRGTYPPGETLRQNVSKETYAKLQSYLADSLGIGSALDSMRPWMAALTTMTLELSKLGFNPEQGVDKYFFTKSKQDGKQIVALETVDLQLGLFTGLSTNEQDAMLQQTLTEIASFRKALKEMTDAWRTGDAQALDRLVLDSMREFPDVHKKLLINRNRQWVGRIEKLMAGRQNVFVVVGAGHLVGRDSVVDLLSQKGFKVRQQ